MNAIALMEVMWDWNSKTSKAGYTELAPRYYRINPMNLSGKRLYDWLGEVDTLLVTNACPELVRSAKERGKPNTVWLKDNLLSLENHPWMQPKIDLLLVCGKVAQDTYTKIRGHENYRVVYCPHPAARGWTKEGLITTKRLIQTSTRNLRIELPKPPSRRVKAYTLTC